VALERRGFAVLPPPPGRIFEPRSGRYEIHLPARELQRSTMRLEEAG